MEREGVDLFRKETLVGYRDRGDRSGGLSADCRGYELRDRNGEKIGKVDEVFVDENDRPEYLGVKTGILGGKLSLIPADLASADEERRLIEVSESRDRVKDAPSLGSNEDITADREQEIRDYFGLGSGDSRTTGGQDDSPGYREDVASGGSSDRGETAHGSEGYGSTEGERPEDATSEQEEPWSGAASGSATGEEARREDTAGRTSGAAERGSETAGYGAASGETGERRETGGTSEGGAGRETVRVTVWREKARAERVTGDDGGEEVRIRKEWVEEEEIVAVEGGSQGNRTDRAR